MQNSSAFKVIKLFVDFTIVSQLIIDYFDDCKTFYEKIKLFIKCISFISLLIERNYESLYGIIITVRERISWTNTNDNKTSATSKEIAKQSDDEHSSLKKNIPPEAPPKKQGYFNCVNNNYN